MKKNKSNENFLEKVPVRKEGLGWSQGEDGMVTLESELEFTKSYLELQSARFGDRVSYNIYCEVPIPVTDAILGAEIDIPTLEGTEKYNIPEGTQPGTRFTMKGKGIPYVNGNGRRGDLIFRVAVEIPKGLSDKQKDAMRAFADSCGESNYAKHKQFFKKIFGNK